MIRKSVLKNSTLVEYELNGRKIVIYRYSTQYVNAFYDPASKGIYIHEKLFNTLNPRERDAIIQHELGHEEQIIMFSKLWWLYSLAISSWLLGGFILILLISYLLTNFLLNILFGKYSIETLIILAQYGTLHPVVSTISLILTSIA